MIYTVEWLVRAPKPAVPTDLIGEAMGHFEQICGGSAVRMGDQVSVKVSIEAADDDAMRVMVAPVRFHWRAADLVGATVGRGRAFRRVPVR